ncbi:hypothetical protein [Undibacterium sp. Tian12W]|uniref:hypothetical protein n=1 Tax=Undibacterium sp. Tian12W TaxID=3413054 RepID=UPI003BF5584E
MNIASDIVTQKETLTPSPLPASHVLKVLHQANDYTNKSNKIKNNIFANNSNYYSPFVPE